jgi:hypothetical protein
MKVNLFEQIQDKMICLISTGKTNMALVKQVYASLNFEERGSAVD